MTDTYFHKNKAPRIRIKQAALDLFSDYGFEAVSVRDIADKARVNVSMISYYFGAKENLLLDIFSEIAQEKNAYKNILLNNSSPSEQLLLLMEDYFLLNWKHWQIFSIAHQELCKSSTGIIHGEILKMKQKFYEVFEQILSNGMRQQVFHTYNKHFIFDLLIGTIHQHLFGSITELRTKELDVHTIDNKDFWDFIKHLINKLLIQQASPTIK